MDVAAKGWTPTPQLFDPETGNMLIPDAVTPSNHPVELKPNTPSGKRQGAKQIKAYEKAMQTNGRVVYYDPLNFLKSE